jgi:hypothetical protein
MAYTNKKNLDLTQEIRIPNSHKPAQGLDENYFVFQEKIMFRSKPIKYLPQTNLMHKNKIKKIAHVSFRNTLNLKKLDYIINNYCKIKVTYSLKTLLDKVISKNPRCKVFRDLYQEKNFNENEIVFSELFRFDSEYPISDLFIIKTWDAVIISPKKILFFDSDSVTVDNHKMVIYNNNFMPEAPQSSKSSSRQAFEYNFINLPAIPSFRQTSTFNKFKPVLMPKRNST